MATATVKVVIRLELGSAADVVEIQSLLEAAGLPRDGLLTVPTRVVVARRHHEVVAAGALERHGSDGLIRSLVVSPEVRSQGVGSGIVAELERQAVDWGLDGAYLLTESAAGFFERLGYRGIGRDEAPDAVRQSAEWATVCDQTAIPMMRAFP